MDNKPLIHRSAAVNLQTFNLNEPTMTNRGLHRKTAPPNHYQTTTKTLPMDFALPRLFLPLFNHIR